MTRGVRDEYHPNRQVGRDRFNPGPPQSEQPGRGVLIDPFDAEYQEIGNTGTFRTPDRSMTVGVRSATEATGPPQSEQPGRGVMAPSWEERFLSEHPYPQEVTGYGPVAEIINDQQWTPS